VTPPLREPVRSFPQPLEAGDRSRVGLCAVSFPASAVGRERASLERGPPTCGTTDDTGISAQRFVVCRACSTAWGCKSPAQPDGGEVLAKRKGVSARRRLKEAWSKTTTRRTEIGYEAGRSGRASGRLRSPYPSSDRPCRSGGCVAKAVELTSGDLRGVPATGLRTS
jgi:hypothetical protein